MNVTFTLLAGIVPAVVSGVIAFAVTTWRLRGELEQQRAGSSERTPEWGRRRR